MQHYARPLARLIGELERLPGIGPKSAQRIAFHLLRVPEEQAAALADAIHEVKEKIGFCNRCYNFSEAERCGICGDPRRDPALLCVVAEPRDLFAVERTQEFRGLYHVLQGVIDPMEGIGPDLLRVRELLDRLSGEDAGVQEIVMATNPTVEGNATAMYLARLLKPLGFRVTRLAHGMPVGGDLDYADQATLIQSLEGRREM